MHVMYGMSDAITGRRGPPRYIQVFRSRCMAEATEQAGELRIYRRVNGLEIVEEF